MGRLREKFADWRMWGLARTFLGFRRFTQVVIMLSLATGLILTVIFTVSDVGGDTWWENKSYVPNVLASLTSFLLGAPVALVVLATFTSEREEKAVLSRVNRLTLLAWYNFRDLINQYASEQRYELVVGPAYDIRMCYDQASTAVQDFIDYVSLDWNYSEPKNYDDPVLVEHLEKLKEIEPKFRAAVNAVRQGINFFETEDEWAQIVGAWQVLDQYVRLQRLEQNLEWFDKTPDAGLRKWISRQGNPLQDFVNAVEIRRYSPDTTTNVDTMANALDALSSYTGTTLHVSELGQSLAFYGNIFTAERSRDYHIKRDAAQLFIIDLKRHIGLVEMTYWPYSATKPQLQNIERELTNNEWIGAMQFPEGRERLEEKLNTMLADRYHEKLRRRPKGHRQGNE